MDLTTGRTATTATSTTRVGLADLVERIGQRARVGTDPAHTAAAVADVLRTRPPTTDLLTAQERHGAADRYTSLILHAEPAFSVVAVVWRPGQQTAIHDHIAWCAFAVVAGTEFETLYRIVDGRPREIGRAANPVGTVCSFTPPGDIHRVRNISSTTAISVHVYGADLRAAGGSVRRTYDLSPA